MKLPEASLGISEEAQLYCIRILTLFTNIFLHHIPVAALPNRGNVIPIRPKFASP
jgi:hypothetical protein